MLRHLINLILWGLPPSRWFELRRTCLNFAKVYIGKGSSFCGRGWIYGRGSLQIGSNTWLSPGVIFHTHLDAPIVIGSNCDIGSAVEFIPGSHCIGNSSRRAGTGIARPIIIGNGTWIGAKSIILGGVSIGDGCIVASGAVVIRDVAPNTLVAGVPARIKKYLSV